MHRNDLATPGPRIVRAACALCTLLASIACSGASVPVRFDHATVPISLSGAVYDEAGAIVGIDELEVVGHLHAEQRGWSLLYSLVPVAAVDFSDAVNEQVEAAGGEAVVRLLMTAALPVWPDQLPGYLGFDWIPLWPGSVRVSVDGDIVRRREDAPDSERRTVVLVPRRSWWPVPPPW